MRTLLRNKGIRRMGNLLLPAIAGLSIALQVAFSGKLNREIGSIETIIAVHLFGLLIATIIYFFARNPSFDFLLKFNGIAIFTGFLGVIIVFTISRSFLVNGALSTILISVLVQIIITKIVDHYGLLGGTRNPFSFMQFIALVIVIVGVVLYQFNE